MADTSAGTTSASAAAQGGVQSSAPRVSIRFISPSIDLADLPIIPNQPVSTSVGTLRAWATNALTNRDLPSTGLRLIYRGRVLDKDDKTLEQEFGLSSIQETEVQTVHIVVRENGLATKTANTTTHRQLHPPIPNVPANTNVAAAGQNMTTGAAVPNTRNTINPAAVQQPNNTAWMRHVDNQIAATANAANQRNPNLVQLGNEAQRLVMMTGTNNFVNAANPAQATQNMPTLTNRNTGASSHGAPPAMRQNAATASGTSWAQHLQPPRTHVLSSPAGPQGLLVNGATQAYYNSATLVSVSNTHPTQASSQWPGNVIGQHNQQIQQQVQQNLMRQHLQNAETLRRLQHQHLVQNGGLQPYLQNYGFPQSLYQQMAQQTGGHQAQHAAGVGPRPFPVAGQVPLPPAPNVNPHLNRQQGQGQQLNYPGAGFLAAMWPHIWLAARLILFVWWFTAPSASWTRWTMVTLFVTAVFVANMGILDGIANQAWAPIRAHLDGLLPFAHGNEAGQQNGQDAANAGNQAAPTGQGNINAGAGAGNPVAPVPVGRAGGPEPNPAVVAARLVERQRRINGERLENLARRLERVAVMFLASLAPGIAERHVEIVEEQAREQRREQQRIREEQAAAAAAATLAAAAAAPTTAAATAAEGAGSVKTEAATANDQEAPASAGTQTDELSSHGELEEEPVVVV